MIPWTVTMAKYNMKRNNKMSKIYKVKIDFVITNHITKINNEI